MKTRDNSVVIEGLQREHRLLAAYLEATNRIDWQPRHKHDARTPEPVNVETQTASTERQLPKVVPARIERQNRPSRSSSSKPQRPLALVPVRSADIATSEACSDTWRGTRVARERLERV